MDFQTIEKQFEEYILENIDELKKDFSSKFKEFPKFEYTNLQEDQLEWLVEFLYRSFHSNSLYRNACEVFYQVYQDHDPCSTEGVANAYFCDFLKHVIDHPVLPDINSNQRKNIGHIIGLFLKATPIKWDFIEEFDNGCFGSHNLHEENQWETS